MAICIQTGWIAWINGPFPAGDWSDSNIAHNGVCEELDPGEKFLVDGIHSSAHGCSEMPTGFNNDDQHVKAVARARHENVNRLFKNFGILERRFCHRVELHGLVFQAVANVIQASILLEKPVFDICCCDNY